MADGYVETGKEVVMYLKNTGITIHDAEAVEAMEQVIASTLKQASGWGVNEERTLRRVFVMGIDSGLQLAATITQTALAAQREEEGKDPVTGRTKKPEAEN